MCRRRTVTKRWQFPSSELHSMYTQFILQLSVSCNLNRCQSAVTMASLSRGQGPCLNSATPAPRSSHHLSPVVKLCIVKHCTELRCILCITPPSPAPQQQISCQVPPSTVPPSTAVPENYRDVLYTVLATFYIL